MNGATWQSDPGAVVACALLGVLVAVALVQSWLGSRAKHRRVKR